MGILGMQLFSGKMHQRCRLTPFPVTADWEPGFDFLEYACLTPNSNIMGKFDPTSIDSVREHNIDLKDADSKYQSKTDSPWNGGHHKSCKWPVADKPHGYNFYTHLHRENNRQVYVRLRIHRIPKAAIRVQVSIFSLVRWVRINVIVVGTHHKKS